MIRFIMLALALVSFSSAARAEAFTPEQKKEIEAMMKQFIMDNPVLMIESVGKHQQEMQEAELMKQNEGVEAFAKKIQTVPNLPTIGNKKGDVTIVEFYDYNCGYCKKAYTEVQKILDEDKNVKLILIDIPILGPSSHEAAKWALAAEKQGKYFEYHQALMKFSGQKDEASLKKLAKDAGLDVAKLEKDKDDPKIEEQLKANSELAAEIAVTGTPAFLINDKIIRGYIEYDGMKALIDQVRNPAKDEAKPDDKKAE